MKILHTYLLTASLCLCSSLCSADSIKPAVPMGPFPVLGEAELTNPSRPGSANSVDWIVSTSDITLNYIPDNNIILKKGTLSDFRNNSVYYYFYQLENRFKPSEDPYSGAEIQSIKLNLNPGTVLTAGYISGNYDLDNSLGVIHFLLGPGSVGAEYDYGNAQVAHIPDPMQTFFNSSNSLDTLELRFIYPITNVYPFTSFSFAQDMESGIFFVTSLEPPDYKAFQTGGLGEPALMGELPVPTVPIPEPTSIILLLSSICWLIKKNYIKR